MVKTIRQKAEALLREQYPVESLIEDKDLPEILHELRVHQVELELQNDELRRTQEDLRATQKKYFELYNFAPVGYFTLNRRGVIKDLNLTAAELLGRDRRRLLNQPLIAHLHANSRLVFFDYLDVLFKTNMHQSCELTLETMQKRITHVQVEGIVDRDQKECRIVMTNISPLKTVKTALEKERGSLAERVKKRTAELTKANEKLILASRHKDEFLANISHELRTPLQAILSGVELLEGQFYGTLNTKQLEMLQRVERGGNHLLRLITDILDLSKIEAEKFDLHLTSVPIPELCQESIDLVQQSAEAKAIDLTVEMDPSLNTIEADEVRLKQILVNLLSNAIKFTPEQGQVGLTVQTDPVRKLIKFMVWDTGIGISESDLEKLFEPFMQIDSGLDRQHEGTGLGLALTKRLTQLHNGKVLVDSTVGQGSQFSVLLPQQQTYA